MEELKELLRLSARDGEIPAAASACRSFTSTVRAFPSASPVVHTAVLSLLQKGSVLAELYYYLQLYNNSVSVLLLCNNKLFDTYLETVENIFIKRQCLFEIWVRHFFVCSGLDLLIDC